MKNKNSYLFFIIYKQSKEKRSKAKNLERQGKQRIKR